MIRKRCETTTIAKDHRIVLYNVSWDKYQTLREALGDDRVKMTYLDGMLELMSPGERHETIKKGFARLIEAYADEKGIEIYAFGSTTYGKRLKRAAHEPDECYTIGVPKTFPDFALEVVVTSGGLKKLPGYKRLRVREVLFWKNGGFKLYRLVGRRYELSSRSEFFPDVDLVLLASLVNAFAELKRPPSDILREFRESLRKA